MFRHFHNDAHSSYIMQFIMDKRDEADDIETLDTEPLVELIVDAMEGRR